MKDKPTRCVDPVMKYCQECPWGWVHYPDDVQTSADLDGCSFESGCSLGFDQGRPEDEPTPAEEFEVDCWLKRIPLTKPLDALPADGTRTTIKLRTGELLNGCYYHIEPKPSFYKYKHGCFSVDAVEWLVKEENENV